MEKTTFWKFIGRSDVLSGFQRRCVVAGEVLENFSKKDKKGLLTMNGYILKVQSS